MSETIRLPACVGKETVRGLLPRAPLAGTVLLDWAGVTDLDSAAVSLALAWQRHGRAHGVAVRHIGLPPAFVSLASLYAVDDFIEVAEGPPSAGQDKNVDETGQSAATSSAA